jgi:hypothetical protein
MKLFDALIVGLVFRMRRRTPTKRVHELHLELDGDIATMRSTPLQEADHDRFMAVLATCRDTAQQLHSETIPALDGAANDTRMWGAQMIDVYDEIRGDFVVLAREESFRLEPTVRSDTPFLAIYFVVLLSLALLMVYAISKRR